MTNQNITGKPADTKTADTMNKQPDRAAPENAVPERAADLFAEHPVQIIVNGRAALTIMTHAENPEHLVYGALLTERVIESADDIESAAYDGVQMSVVTKNPYPVLLSRKTVLAGCGGASSFLDSGTLGMVSGGDAVFDETVRAAASEVPDTLWYAAGLFSADGKLLCAAEDVTAQNAADQLIGCALINGITLSKTFAVLKGNCTVETVRKLVIGRIPVFGICGALTAAAQATADDAGLRVVRI